MYGVGFARAVAFGFESQDVPVDEFVHWAFHWVTKSTFGSNGKKIMSSWLC